MNRLTLALSLSLLSLAGAACTTSSSGPASNSDGSVPAASTPGGFGSKGVFANSGSPGGGTAAPPATGMMAMMMSGGMAGVCAAEPSDTACSTCGKGSCCAEGTACANNPACVALVDCVEKCGAGDSGCTNACTNKNSGGVQAYAAFGQCVTGKCSKACGIPAGSGGSSGSGGAAGSGGMCKLPPNPDACDRCLSSSCCSQLNACDATPACAKLVSCLTACKDGDKACSQGCTNANPAGVTPLSNLLQCVDGPCGKDCD